MSYLCFKLKLKMTEYFTQKDFEMSSNIFRKILILQNKLKQTWNSQYNEIFI